jgi:hypothetical protein
MTDVCVTEFEVAALPGEPGPVGPTPDISGKLDKQDDETAYDETYAKLADGRQDMLTVTASTLPSSVVRRDGYGRIQAADGLSAADVATISQLAAKISTSVIEQVLSGVSTTIPSSYAVATAIADAISAIVGVGFTAEVVTELPATGANGVFYFVGEEGGPYEEYVWLASETRFEYLGSTQIDLSGVLHLVTSDGRYRLTITPSPTSFEVTFESLNSDTEQWETAGEFLVASPGAISASGRYGGAEWNLDLSPSGASFDSSAYGNRIRGALHPMEGIYVESEVDPGLYNSFRLGPALIQLTSEAVEAGYQTDLRVDPEGATVGGEQIATVRARQTKTFTTGPIEATTPGGEPTWQSTIPLAAGWRVYAISASTACRIRLYTSPDAATGDAGRPPTEDPPPNAGCLLDVVLTDTYRTGFSFSPLVDGYTTDGTQNVAVIVDTPEVAADGMTFTLTWIRTE